MTLRFSIVSLLILLGCSEDQPTTSKANIEALRSADSRASNAAASQALMDRRAVVKVAVEVLESSDKPFTSTDPRISACNIVAEYRAPEAVNALLKLIELETASPFKDDKSPWNYGDQYPAAKALVNIGNPARLACIGALGNPYAERRDDILCWVVGQIDGHEVGRYCLELTIRDERDPRLKEKLTDALKTYDAVWQAEREKWEKLKRAAQRRG